MTYVLEMRSTADWQDVRYRAYTTSRRKADLFRQVPKIKFTDNAHHIVPVVSETKPGSRRLPVNDILRDHVEAGIRGAHWSDVARVKKRKFTQEEAQEMRDAIDRIESALTAWGLPDKRRLWAGAREDLEINVGVPHRDLRDLADAYDLLNEIINR